MIEKILVDTRAPLATVTLNRPERLNALDEESWRLLGEAFETLDKNDELRCIVVRGAGDRAFCAGADVAEFAERRSDIEQATAYGKIELAGIEAAATCRHPTIAQIHGVCVGGGLEVALACDLRVCAESSRFGVPVNQLGLSMSYGELTLLQRTVGPAAASEILLSGEVFGGERALRLGLVSRVVADDELTSEVAALTGLIIERAPLVNRWHKKFIRRLEDPAPLTDTEIAEGYACFGTEDYRTGFEAFLEKHKPKFEGR
jgi:enoyl-CoA hydratase/carnithine racemase